MVAGRGEGRLKGDWTHGGVGGSHSGTYGFGVQGPPGMVGVGPRDGCGGGGGGGRTSPGSMGDGDLWGGNSVVHTKGSGKVLVIERF